MKSHIQKFTEIEEFLTSFQLNDELPKDLIFFDDQITFIVQNIIEIHIIRPFKHEIIHNLIFKLYNNLKNNELFKRLILLIGYEKDPLLIFQLLKKKLFFEHEIKFFSKQHDLNKSKVLFTLYFPTIFDLNKKKFLKSLKRAFPNSIMSFHLIKNENNQFQFFINNNYEKLYELIEFGWFKDSIEYFIKFDEINNFISLYNERGFNNQTKSEISIFEFFLKQKFYTFLELTSLYGSILIFKFLINQEKIISKKIPLYCLKSGNLELIQFFNFNEFLKYPLETIKNCYKFRYYDIFKWFKEFLSDGFQFKDKISINSIKFFNDNFILPNLELPIEYEYHFILSNIFIYISNHQVPKYFYSKSIDTKKLFLYCCKKGFFEIIKLFVEKGFEINYINHLGYNALHYCCKNGFYEISEYLINKGIEINIQDNNEYFKTPLHISCERGYFELVKLLIKNGANINIKDKINRNCLNYACYSGDLNIIQYLILNNCEINLQDSIDGKTPLFISLDLYNIEISKFLIENGANYNIIDNLNNNILHYCAFFGELNLFEYFFNKGININNQNLYYDHNSKKYFPHHTPLHICAKYNILNIANFIINNNGNINIQNFKGKTPLHICCQKCNFDFCKLLINNKIDKSLKDINNKTSLDYCIEYNLIELIKIF